MQLRSMYVFILLILTSAMSLAQVSMDIDGLYYNENDELYTGTYIEFHTNGNKKIEVSLAKGLPNGPISIYFETGQINETRSYEKGKMHGTWITWNEEGVKVAQAQYKENLKHGDWYIWDDAGTQRFEMHYAMGQKIGTWKMYNEKGELVSSELKKE